MAKFDIPVIPDSINVKNWDKKRELLSRSKPSGVTEAIKKFLAAYNAVGWSAYEKSSKYEIDAGALAGNRGPVVVKEFEALKKIVTAQKAGVASGPVSKLRKAALDLHKTAKEATSMFKSENYPKAVNAAAEIAEDALRFSGEVRPERFVEFWDDLLAASVGIINGKIAHALGISIATPAAKNITTISNLLGIAAKNPKEAASQYNKIKGTDAVCRATVVQVVARTTMARLFGVSYPLANADQAYRLLAPYKDGSSKTETEDSIVDALKTILKGLKAAQKLPDEIGRIIL
jgi:hypothetical protein